MRVVCIKNVSDGDDYHDDNFNDERQEDIHRDEGYLMREVMTNTAQLVKQTAHQVCQCLILVIMLSHMQ